MTREQIILETEEHNKRITQELHDNFTAIQIIAKLMHEHRKELINTNLVSGRILDNYMVGLGWKTLFHAFDYLEARATKILKEKI